jgi:hypothetical protein
MSVLGLLTACQGSNGSGDSGPVDAAVTPADAGDPDATPPGRLYAFVSVERWTRGSGAPSTMGGLVSFHQEQPAPYVTRIDEHCIVHEEGWSENGLVPPAYGTVRIEGVAAGTVVWQDGPEGPGFDVTPGGFAEGDVLTVATTGAAIPAFSFTGTLPGVPVLTSHDNTGAGPGVITAVRTQPFDVTWTPVDGEVFVLFLQFSQAGARLLHGIQCFFPGPDGAATIPAAALGHLLASPQVDRTNFYFARIHRERLELPSIDLDFLLWNGRMTRVTVE